MKTILAVFVLALASACASNAPVVETSRNYVTSFEKGGCNDGKTVCPHAKDLDEGLGGTGGGATQ